MYLFLQLYVMVTLKKLLVIPKGIVTQRLRFAGTDNTTRICCTQYTPLRMKIEIENYVGRESAKN